MTMVRITKVVPLQPGFLSLSWDDGHSREVDITDWLTKHPLLEMLQVPEVFKDVSIVEGGGGIEWANGADFCAQALRRHAEQNEPQDMKANV